ncbi:transposase [Novosphingobium sp. BW1]|uniref:transposase n=1 Tax=Novosphingobium sp. BW1 TaxID=2592621 RepID=UPI0011DE962B|nr:transposase [Novosphingobium sp. BW1]TYC92867.1 hypothetical protein FMM79_02350 [Novosphingobium sp. BW1]
MRDNFDGPALRRLACNSKIAPPARQLLALAQIALAVAPGAHAVVLMDQAGWHVTGELKVPANIGIVALPAKCPELHSVEDVWQFMRDNWFSSRIFISHDNTIDRRCEAWSKLVDQLWAHHDHRTPQMGPEFPINAGWYKPPEWSRLHSRYTRPAR